MKRLRARDLRRLRFPAALAAGALVLAGCSNYSGGHSQQVAQWVSGSQLSANDGYVVADLRDIEDGISAGNLAATHTACDGLATDAATAYGELPTPDALLTADLDTAYLAYIRAAEDCSSAGSFSSPGFHRYRGAVANGTRALDAARRRLRDLGAG